jgi:flagellar L-ring protein precursor FlgH
MAVMVATASIGQGDAQTRPPSDNYDVMFERYLQAARADGSRTVQETSWNWMSGLGQDRRARQVNDLLTIRVVESITGSGSADAGLSKASDASISLPKFFGLEKKLPSAIDPSALASLKNNTDFKGSGSTTRAGELTAQMTARVADVLSNGDLVVEGIREIEINGDRQIVVLSGVVRVADIAPSNMVLSTSIGQLRIRYFGRGLMKDNLKPGFLIRLLNRIF